MYDHHRRWEPGLHPQRRATVTRLLSTAIAPSVTSIATVSPHTLGEELERDRLERRVSRVTVAVAVLRDRVSAYRPEAAAPPRHLLRAVADFEAQIEALSARLRDLGRDHASTGQVDGTERSR
jgi:hypothetical protein